MKLTGKLRAASPIYRGNARKTLCTRALDGTHRLVSLPGEFAGTAQASMDALIGESPKGRNSGLLNRLWQHLYDELLPKGLISAVPCQLAPESYPTCPPRLAQPKHIDLRSGGPFSRKVSRQYGEPYDTICMRMLAWAPAAGEDGTCIRLR